jgi:predicted lipoprotein
MTRTSTGVFLAIATLALGSCTPWTVRPIDSDKDTKAGGAALNPAAYVDAIWSSRLIPAILGSAVDVRTLLDAVATSPSAAREKFGRRDPGGPAYFLVKGEGRVLSADTRSRIGVLFVDVAPFDRRADVAIQIGPVLRGTALRDATGLVRFTDFINQLQFADVANEMNARVLKTVLAPLTPSALENRIVSFAGVATLDDAAQPPVRDLIPVRLAVEAPR